MRRALLLAVAVLATAPPVAADASARLDTVAAALQRDTVVVSPDMQDAFPPSVADWLRERIEALDVPFDVRVAVLPLVDTDESGGDEDRVLYALSDRLPERPRVLVLVGNHLDIDLLPTGVRRRIASYGDYRHADQRTEAELRGRLGAALREIATAPAGEPYVDERPEGEPDPVFRSDRGEDDTQDGPGWRSMLVLWAVGATLGIGAWGVRRPWR